MDYLSGALLAAALVVASHGLELHRSRAFYPTVMMVIALAYVLLAAADDAFRLAAIEALAALPFLVAAGAGFRSNLWIVVAALAAHGAFDLARHALLPVEPVPGWYAGFCTAVDGLLALHLAALLLTHRLAARPGGAQAGMATD